MKNGIAVLVVMLVCLIPTSWALSGQGLTEGQWQFTISSEAEDMSSYPHSFTACLSNENPVPMRAKNGITCEYGDVESDGDLLVWSRRCKDGSGKEYQSNAEVQCYGDTMEGVVYTVINDPGGGLFQLSEEMSGKLIGPCAKTE